MANHTLHMYQEPDNQEIVETLTDGGMWESLAGHLTAGEITCLCILLRRTGADDTELAQIWEEWERQEPDAQAETVNNATEITMIDEDSLARITPPLPPVGVIRNYTK
ncbi:hypothetical protein ACT3SZ_15060 [Corynebacterium sp. AOP40-9SA-29]|uniref:hypothetical protein n=1 Tax=Corynebacterium sp. AOP40-9SA-29 TaxID=3457677 RepID=UPI00403370B1